ncbi:MAG: hypothetical protein IJO16_05010 [Clostridia bacterium]|nr:hypothetical protein [Clostridia bacterium]
MLNKKIVIGVIAAVVILVCALAVMLSPSAGVEDYSEVLTKYFTAYYVNASVPDIQECMPNELKEEADLAFTLGGTVNILSGYKLDTLDQVGEDAVVTVEITNKPEPKATLRNQYKMEFANVGMAVNTEFDVNIKGSAGELNFNGYADLVQIDGQWYLTNYSIPLYSQE